jgi:predicted GNAT superfamily acetyltransferase
MRNIVIRDARATDFATICALNLAAVEHTSPMDPARLDVLARLSCHHKVASCAGQVLAFLLAMRRGAAYENANFNWFTRTFDDFVYVDRIVVSAASRGLRLGSLLYEDLFHYARDHAVPFVTCEYNLSPPNEPSRLFHDKFGFKQQGTQWVADHTKFVSLQAAAT